MWEKEIKKLWEEQVIILMDAFQSSRKNFKRVEAKMVQQFGVKAVREFKKEALERLGYTL